MLPPISCGPVTRFNFDSHLSGKNYFSDAVKKRMLFHFHFIHSNGLKFSAG